MPLCYNGAEAEKLQHHYFLEALMKKEMGFGLLLSRAERRALDKLAEAEGGLSRAAKLRLLIRKEAHRHDIWPSGDFGDNGRQKAQHD